MSQQEIERAACRPHRWIRILRKHQGPFFPTFINHPPLASLQWHIPRPYFQRITAGGRYLVEAVGYPRQDVTLKVWDLGVPGRINLLTALVLVASKVVQGTDGTTMISCCSTGDSILVASTWRVASRKYRYVSTN